MSDTSQRLPNAERAYVAERKITHYLLSLDHEKGRGKALFLMRFGFTADQPGVLVEALSNHAKTNEVDRAQTTPHGQVYEISGPMYCPDGRMPIERTAWIILDGEDHPRFVTWKPD